MIINNKKIKRNNLINYLKKYGIETRPIVCGNIMKSEMIKYFNFSNNSNKNFYNSDFINKNGFFIGNSHKNLNKEISYLRKTIDDFILQSN